MTAGGGDEVRRRGRSRCQSACRRGAAARGVEMLRAHDVLSDFLFLAGALREMRESELSKSAKEKERE